MNGGAGYGLEIPCTYRLYGPPAYVNRMQEIARCSRTYCLKYYYVMYNNYYCTVHVTVRYLGGQGAGLTRGGALTVGGRQSQYESMFGDVLHGCWSE